MKRGAAIRGLVVSGAFLLSACGTNDSNTVGPGGDPAEMVDEAQLPAANGAVPPDKRASLGASPAVAQEPLECRDVFEEKPCMRYRIPLLGNPSTDPVPRAKYKAAFGSACYMSAANTFDCFYKAAQMTATGKACTDAQMIAKVFGVAEYAKGYECKKIGNGTQDWWLQVGPDVTNKIDIKLEIAPLESPLIDIGNGVQVAINGPYRNLPEPSKVLPGTDFHCYRIDGMTQKDRILQMNRDAHKNAAGVGEIHSDLAGFTWPCKDEDNKMTTCTEETVLKEPSENHRDAARVHHVIRMTDLRSCKWGSNSNKNALVISRKLNGFLKNKYPQAIEVKAVNLIPPYAP